MIYGVAQVNPVTDLQRMIQLSVERYRMVVKMAKSFQEQTENIFPSKIELLELHNNLLIALLSSLLSTCQNYQFTLQTSTKLYSTYCKHSYIVKPNV